MTPEQAILKLEQTKKALEQLKPYTEVFNEVKRIKTNRIFVENKNAAGGSIGEYSKNDLYVNPLVAPRKFATKGKSGETKFKNGKPHKTAYFNGYAQYKSTIGEGTDVNLRLFRNFEVSFKTADSAYYEGENIGYNIQIPNTVKNPSGKIEGILDKYPGTFEDSKDEREFIVAELKNIVLNLWR